MWAPVIFPKELKLFASYGLSEIYFSFHNDGLVEQENWGVICFIIIRTYEDVQLKLDWMNHL